jgi:hypothetical protein
MALSKDELDALLNAPHENLDVELKSWINPSADDAIAKIARSCIALRNNNGGHLVIGIRNDGQPDQGNAPSDPSATFHVDTIQRIVGLYSSELFAIEVQFGARGGQLYPVISIPPGVRTPVAAKRDLESAGKLLIKDHAVYVRSLSSNNTVSSSEARRGDWERLVQICFDNREADIGGFVRRHLAALDMGQFAAFQTALSGVRQQSSTERAREILDDGRRRCLGALSERSVDVSEVGVREAAVVVDGEVPPHAVTNSFMQKLFVSQPRHTGWPVWLDSRPAKEEADRPRVSDGAFEALLVGRLLNRSFIDYWRIDPRGVFYAARGIEDDLSKQSGGPTPGTQLDFLLQVSRVAEIISVALSFARAMGCDASKTSLVFAFRWNKLKGRHLTSWVEPQRSYYSSDQAYQDEFVTDVTVPLDTPLSALSPHVERAVRGLFGLFGGMEFESQVIEGIVKKSLETRF